MKLLKRKTGFASVLAGLKAISRSCTRCQATGAIFIKAAMVIFWGVSATAFAQAPLPSYTNQPPLPGAANYTNCIVLDEQAITNPTAPTNSKMMADYGPNGYMHTPTGDLKILVIFAGFEDDNSPSATFGNDSDPLNDWPQTDATHPVHGTAFPRNTGSFFYTNNNQFSPTATDLSISNFFYKMSNGQFKITAGYFPIRVNVAHETDTAKINIVDYTQKVFDKVVQLAPNYPAFPWASFDQRRNLPGFASNNSAYDPDGAIDYVVVLWRIYPNSPQINNVPKVKGGGGGWAAGNTFSNTHHQISHNGKTYYITGGHADAQNAGGFHRELFKHEFAHNIYAAPHYLGANTSHGKRFYNTYGWGIMSTELATNECANAWERWYLGWIDIKTVTPQNTTTQINSDIQSAADLAATNGEYTLRDFVTYGDVVRIKIPHTNQHLWLENHTGATVWDNRASYDLDPMQVPYKDPPRGLLAFVENIAENRERITSALNMNMVNGIKVMSAFGNNDYPIPAGQTPTPIGLHLFDNGLYNHSTPVANPAGGCNEISKIKADNDQNDTINYDSDHGNYDKILGHEFSYMAVINGNYVDGFLGANIGFNIPGQKMGLSHNPMIIPHQTYDKTTQKLSPITLHGLSVEVTGKNTTTGDITIKVRFNENDITHSTRWTGNLILPTGMMTTVKTGKQLTINKSGTPNRETKLNGDFINPTVFTCKTGSSMIVEGSATVLVDKGTTFKMEAGSNVTLQNGATFIVRGNSTLEIDDNALFTLSPNSTLWVEEGSQVFIRNTALNKGLVANSLSAIHVTGESLIMLENGTTFKMVGGSNATLQNGATFVVGGSSTLEIEDNALFTLTPNSTLWVEEGSQVIIRNTVFSKGLVANNLSAIHVNDESRIIIENGALFRFQNLAINKGLFLNDYESELLNKGTLHTNTNVHLTFGGSGFITFEGAGSKVNLAANSKIMQQGSGSYDVLYKLKDNVNLKLKPYQAEIKNGAIQYSNGASLTIRNVPVSVVFNNVNFVRESGSSIGAMALRCANTPSLALTACSIKNFSSEGLQLDSVANTTITNSVFEQNGTAGISANRYEGTIILNNSAIRTSEFGILVDDISNNNPNPLKFYLRNKAKIEENQIGIKVSSPGGFPTEIIAGDLGCAWIINNEMGAIQGEDVYLSIDAISHQGSNCYPQINRFDGNTGQGYPTFEIYYTGTIPNQRIAARGNYWGSGFSSTDFKITDDKLGAGNPVDVDTDSYKKCQPISCESCDLSLPICGGTGGGGSRVAANQPKAPNGKPGTLMVTSYPNPASQSTTILVEDQDAGDNFTFRMTNSVGAVVKQGRFTGRQAEITTASLPNGIYAVEVVNSKMQAKTIKVVVMH